METVYMIGNWIHYKSTVKLELYINKTSHSRACLSCSCYYCTYILSWPMAITTSMINVDKNIYILIPTKYSCLFFNTIRIWQIYVTSNVSFHAGLSGAHVVFMLTWIKEALIVKDQIVISSEYKPKTLSLNTLCYHWCIEGSFSLYINHWL